MKNYVQINSQVTINATCGLQFKNKTNPNSRLENNMKIDPTWAKLCVVVKKGVHWYPSEVAEWHSVKALIEHGLATLGVEADECDDSEACANKRRIVNLYASEGLGKPAEEPKKRGHRKHEDEKPVEEVKPVEEPKEEAPKGDSLEDLAGDDEEDEKEAK